MEAGLFEEREASASRFYTFDLSQRLVGATEGARLTLASDKSSFSHASVVEIETSGESENAKEPTPVSEVLSQIQMTVVHNLPRLPS
jgi:hypothetical protein